MFDNEYIDNIYQEFIKHYKTLLKTIPNKNEYDYLKPWLDFIMYCIKELSTVYNKNKKRNDILQFEFILVKKTNKITSIETYICENYDELKMSKNFDKFREKIIDDIVINFSGYNVGKYYNNKITNIITFPDNFILTYNKLLHYIYLIYSYIYLNTYSRKFIKKMIISDHQHFISILNTIEFRTDIMLSINM